MVVLGNAPEIVGPEDGDYIVARHPLGSDLDGIVIAAVVLDLRTHSVEELAATRRMSALAQAPALLVSAFPPTEETMDTLRATDIVIVPASARAIARRLAVMVELGRRRLAIDMLRQFEDERRRFERLVALGTMVAGFAHEVRNPVAALRSIAEEVADELSEAGLHLPHIERMLRVLDRIEGLVRASLQFGRPATPRRGAHRPWTILSAALSAIGPRTRSSGGEIQIEVEPDLPDVLCDEGQIAQVLVILLNNALDAVGTSDRVTLRATRPRADEDSLGVKLGKMHDPTAWVQLDVADDGPGISPDIIGQIFDPFFTTKAAGTGLGLSIAQQVVGENQSRLEVSSRRGGPTTFTLLVPVVGNDEPRDSTRRGHRSDG